MQKTRLAAGLRPDLLGELTALPRPPSWIEMVLLLRGLGREKEGKRRGREGKGEDLAPRKKSWRRH